MSTDNIFGNDPATPAAVPQTQPTGYDNLLGMIVNERGEQKYKNVEEALKGASHAQAYIQTLLADKLALEAKVAAASQVQSREAELEQTLKELLSKQGQQAAHEPAAAIDPDLITEAVMNRINAKQQQDIAQANQQAVAKTLLEKFGADAEQKYNAVAAELGMTVAEMNQFAAKSPKAVLKALGVDTVAPKAPNVSPAASAVNSAAFQPQQDSFVKRNTESMPLGATTQQINAESARARAMVEELHSAGMEVGDLADPKVFFKYFN